MRAHSPPSIVLLMSAAAAAATAPVVSSPDHLHYSDSAATLRALASMYAKSRVCVAASASEQPVGSLYSSSMCGAPPPAPPYTFATARHVDPKGFLSCKTLIDDGGRCGFAALDPAAAVCWHCCSDAGFCGKDGGDGPWCGAENNLPEYSYAKIDPGSAACGVRHIVTFQSRQCVSTAEAPFFRRRHYWAPPAPSQRASGEALSAALYTAAHGGAPLGVCRRQC